MPRRNRNSIESTDEPIMESVNETFSEPIEEIKPERKRKTSKIIDEPSPVSEIKETKFVVKVDGNGYLRVRKGPGLDYEVEKQLPNGTPVTATEIKDGWAKIGKDLWVMKEFLV